MTVQTATLTDLRGWTDGPKVVIDMMAAWKKTDFPDTVIFIVGQEHNVEHIMELCPPPSTFYISAPEHVVEFLAGQFKNNVFRLVENV